jgi:hypothetical protein
METFDISHGQQTFTLSEKEDVEKGVT